MGYEYFKRPLEIEGYRQLWMAIFEAEAVGLLSAN